MDTSVKNVRMLLQAEEIQSRKQCPHKVDPVNVPWWGADGNCWFNINNDRIVWIPSQSDLQEMIDLSILNIESEFNTFPSISCLIDDVNDFLHPVSRLGVMPHKRSIDEANKAAEYVGQFTSMEQLWLAFVMQTNYRKHWLGEHWVKI
jgi:hypothetical protein